MASESEASCEGDPNFAVICGFLEKFGALCGLATIDFHDLQEVLENTHDVPQFLVDLHIKLLRKVRKSVSSERWERAVIKVCHSYNTQDAWEIERFGYKKARIGTKLRLLKELLEMQFDLNFKFKSEINKMSAEDLRTQPIGRDKMGHAYWYQSDESCQIRVYKEDPDEESWALVAKDRNGLVSLISELDGKDSSEESVMNEDSNSLEIEKPILDTGQVDSTSESSKPSMKSSEEEDETSTDVKLNNEEDEMSTDVKLNNEEDETSTDVKLNNQEDETSTDVKLNNEEDKSSVDDEKSSGVEEEKVGVKVDEENSSEISTDIISDTTTSTGTDSGEKPKPVVEMDETIRPLGLRLKPLTELLSQPHVDSKPELSGVKEKYIRGDTFSSMSNRKAVDSASGFAEIYRSDLKRPVAYNIEQPSLLKRSRIDRPTLLGNKKMLKPYIPPEDDEEVGEAIEEPLMLVMGKGSGEDNNSECPIVGEVIEEDVCYVYGEGTGVDCLMGNEDEKAKNSETLSDSKKEAFRSPPKKSRWEEPEDNNVQKLVDKWENIGKDDEKSPVATKQSFFFGPGSGFAFKSPNSSPIKSTEMSFGEAEAGASNSKVNEEGCLELSKKSDKVQICLNSKGSIGDNSVQSIPQLTNDITKTSSEANKIVDANISKDIASQGLKSRVINASKSETTDDVGKKMDGMIPTGSIEKIDETSTKKIGDEKLVKKTEDDKIAELESAKDGGSKIGKEKKSDVGTKNIQTTEDTFVGNAGGTSSKNVDEEKSGEQLKSKSSSNIEDVKDFENKSAMGFGGRFTKNVESKSSKTIEDKSRNTSTKTSEDKSTKDIEIKSRNIEGKSSKNIEDTSKNIASKSSKNVVSSRNIEDSSTKKVEDTLSKNVDKCSKTIKIGESLEDKTVRLGGISSKMIEEKSMIQKKPAKNVDDIKSRQIENQSIKNVDGSEKKSAEDIVTSLNAEKNILQVEAKCKEENMTERFKNEDISGKKNAAKSAKLLTDKSAQNVSAKNCVKSIADKSVGRIEDPKPVSKIDKMAPTGKLESSSKFVVNKSESKNEEIKSTSKIEEIKSTGKIEDLKSSSKIEEIKSSSKVNSKKSENKNEEIKLINIESTSNTKDLKSTSKTEEIKATNEVDAKKSGSKMEESKSTKNIAVESSVKQKMVEDEKVSSNKIAKPESLKSNISTVLDSKGPEEVSIVEKKVILTSKRKAKKLDKIVDNLGNLDNLWKTDNPVLEDLKVVDPKISKKSETVSSTSVQKIKDSSEGHLQDVTKLGDSDSKKTGCSVESTKNVEIKLDLGEKSKFKNEGTADDITKNDGTADDITKNDGNGREVGTKNKNDDKMKVPKGIKQKATTEKLVEKDAIIGVDIDSKSKSDEDTRGPSTKKDDDNTKIIKTDESKSSDAPSSSKLTPIDGSKPVESETTKSVVLSSSEPVGDSDSNSAQTLEEQSVVVKQTKRSARLQKGDDNADKPKLLSLKKNKASKPKPPAVETVRKLRSGVQPATQIAKKKTIKNKPKPTKEPKIKRADKDDDVVMGEDETSNPKSIDIESQIVDEADAPISNKKFCTVEAVETTESAEPVEEVPCTQKKVAPLTQDSDMEIEESVKKPEEKKLTLLSLSFDYTETTAADVQEVIKRVGRKRGRVSPVPEPVDDAGGKRRKVRGKRSIDVELRRSIEEKKMKEIVISSEEETEQPPKKHKPKKHVETDEPPTKPKKERNKKRRTLLGLDIPDETVEDTPIGVRQSRRIAQIKIKEEAERRKIEDIVLPDIKDKKEKKRKKKNDDNDYKAEKRKRNKLKPPSTASSSEGGETTQESDDKKKRKKKRRPNNPKFDEANPWKSSSDSSSASDEEEEEHEYEHEEEDDRRSQLFKSDHEFSPESDLEDGSEPQLLKRARTVRKENAVPEEEEIDDTNCQKCGKSDHPEWILLCDGCDYGWHCSCLRPALLVIPEGDWYCPPCQHSKLVKNLNNRLIEFDKQVSKREIEVRRKERLAYVGISLDNVLPTKEHDDKKPKHRKNSDESESPRSSSSSSSESTSDSDDEPIYQLRQRRQAHSYRFNDYDDLINSAIQEEVAAVQTTQLISRGKDMANITPEAPEALPPVVPVNTDLPEALPLPTEESDDDIVRPVKKLIGKKKHRKLNSLDDVSSGDDEHASDEDFKGSSLDEDEEDEFDEDLGSDSSDFGRRGRRGPVRRSNRARVSRFDREFINDDSEDEAPRRKKTRPEWDESESEESDQSWGRRKRRGGGSRRAPAPTPRKKKSKKKKKNDDDSDVEVYRKKKPKIKYGGLETDDEDEGDGRRKTRGRKINYVDVLGTDSEDENGRRRNQVKEEESEEEFVLNEDNDNDGERDSDDSNDGPMVVGAVVKVGSKKGVGKGGIKRIIRAQGEEEEALFPPLEQEPATEVVAPPPPAVVETAAPEPIEPNPIEEINKNLEAMDEKEMEMMMEEEEYANRQLQMVAAQLEKEKRRRELEAAKQRLDTAVPVVAPPPIQIQSVVAAPVPITVVEEKTPKKRGRKPKSALTPPGGEATGAFNITPPVDKMEMGEFGDAATLVAVNPDGTPKKRRGRGKGKKTLEKEAAAAAATSTQPSPNLSRDSGDSSEIPLTVEAVTTNKAAPLADSSPQMLGGKLGVASAPQPFSQSQPKPSVITRMLQTQPGQPSYPVGAVGGHNYFADQRPEGPSPPLQGGPPPFISGPGGPRGVMPPGFRPGMNHYPPPIRGVAPRLRSPGPPHMFHPMEPAPSGGPLPERSSPNVVSPASASPVSTKGDPTPPPPPYIRPPMPRFPQMPNTPPRHLMPQHLQSRPPYHPNMPPNFHYGPYPPPPTNEEAGAFQNTPPYPPEHYQPPEPPTDQPKNYDEENGEFGGLVSYFSSQREDDLDT